MNFEGPVWGRYLHLFFGELTVPEDIVVISKNPIAREGLCRIISDSHFSVVGSAGDAGAIDWDGCPEEVLAVVDGGSADEQIAAVEGVILNREQARCVVLVEEFDMETMIACFRRQAHGYLVKDISCTPLLASLQLVSLGERVFPSNLVEVLARQSGTYEAFADAALGAEDVNLSQREMDVLCCLMAGYSNKLIARQLDLSEATVKVHVKAILRKLKVGNRTQAAMWGTTRGVAYPVPQAMVR